MLNPKQLQKFVDAQWDNSIVPTLEKFIRIPNKSPAFDAEWQAHGYMAQAVELVANWCKAQNVVGMQLEVVQLPGRTPLLFIEVPGQPISEKASSSRGLSAGSRTHRHDLDPADEPRDDKRLQDQTILLYGHLDKQPEMEGWLLDLDPWKPVIKGDKLYGRGGADDGYAAFASITAIKALQEQNIPHARCVIIIEACEESGSYDLPFYIDALASRIGRPELVICLDSGCGNYEQLWSTTSLRGLAAGVLSIELMTEGVHSGNGSGIVASTFRVLRQLLTRVEDENTGRILLESLNTTIPAQRQQQAKLAAQVLGEQVYNEFPLQPNAKPVCDNPTELILNRTWRPTLSVIGVEGIPSLDNAGSVLRPKTAVKLSFRLPPNCDAEKVSADLKHLFESNPPYGAKVQFTPEKASAGWDAPPLSEWLREATEEASLHYFGQSAMYMGEGGTIPFMGMLGKKFPQAQFLISGVLGPKSNAHGPNEFLHIPTGKKLTACVAHVIAKINQTSCGSR